MTKKHIGFNTSNIGVNESLKKKYASSRRTRGKTKMSRKPYRKLAIYNDEGELIDVFLTNDEAIKKVISLQGHQPRQTIITGIGRAVKDIHHKVYGYRWVSYELFEDEEQQIGVFKEKVYKRRTGKDVVVYDLDGSFINRFDGASSAAKWLSKRNPHASISNIYSAGSRCGYSSGYLWRLIEKGEDHLESVKPYVKPKPIPLK